MPDKCSLFRLKKPTLLQCSPDNELHVVLVYVGVLSRSFRNSITFAMNNFGRFYDKRLSVYANIDCIIRFLGRTYERS